MPIHEYRCEPCEKTFETLIRGGGDVPHCPDCGTIDVAKQFSVPAAARAEGGPSAREAAPLPMMGGCGAGGCGSGMCAAGLKPGT